MKIAVIGAGTAGLTAARQLVARGHAVTVYDKSRGTGGRMSTRRVSPWIFDHGAQYFTAREPEFQRAVRKWLEQGVVLEWSGRLVELRAGGHRVRDDGDRRYVAPNGMSSVARHLARGMDLRLRSQVRSVRRHGEHWAVDGDERFEGVVVATPAPQAVPLLAAAPDLAVDVAEARMEPCLALMLAIPDGPDPEFEGAFVQDSPLAWVSHRQGRWVAHATPAWSLAHFELPEEYLREELVTALERALGTKLPWPDHASVHRWRYARTVLPLGRPSLWDERLQIGACGDWCLGARVESAFLSGLDLAGRIDRAVSLPPR